VLARSQGLPDLLRPRIGESEQADHVDAGIGEDAIRSFIDSSLWNHAASELPRGGIGVVHGANFPKIVLLHRGYKTATHAPVSENSRPESLCHSP
jgi:hypothetical protein